MNTAVNKAMSRPLPGRVWHRHVSAPPSPAPLFDMNAAVVEELPWSAHPENVFRRFASRPFSQFLDSSDCAAVSGRWSILVSDPFATLSLRASAPTNPFTTLRARLSAFAVPATWREEVGARLHAEPPPFLGGAMGMFGYELASCLESLPSMPRDRGRKDMIVGLYDSLLAFDHRSGRVFSVSTGLREKDKTARARLCRRWAACWRRRMADAGSAENGPHAALVSLVPHGEDAWRSNFTRSGYEAAVARIIRYIRAGDIFQVNLARRFDLRLDGSVDPFAFYIRLRRISPAPFAAYLNLGRLAILSSSPERFLENRAGLIRSQPIKGTRPRGTTPLQDREHAAALLASAKDRAENVMIVDLLRNDISKVAQPHSVGVARLCALKRFAGVHHLVSTVTGHLRATHDSIDLLAGCFPGGSVTGAPKPRAMEIIAELEGVSRGAYCGAIGHIGFDGDMDSSIAIRTIAMSGTVASFHVGGGVVMDSDPAQEYEETVTKGRAMAEALTGSRERIFTTGGR